MADEIRPDQARPDRVEPISTHDESAAAPAPEARKLSSAAMRALSEAEARRRAAQSSQDGRPAEINGPRGLEPTRYGDWERKGVASDF